MFGKRKKTLTLKVFVVLLSLAMTTAAFSANSGSARIIPSGKVLMMKNGQVVGEFSNEAPLPEGVLLKCEGQCSVKLDDVYMVVEQDTVFSVQPMAAHTQLFIHEGTVYYSLTEASRPLYFNTPAGDATTGDLSLSGTELRGYVRVSGNKTEIGVIEGGTMMLKTASGDLAVVTGRKITFAYAPSSEPVPVATDTGGMTRGQKIGMGAVGAGLLAAGVFALAGSSGSSSSSSGGSPAAP